jgi:REP element-mobilizing transposase RayT
MIRATDFRSGKHVVYNIQSHLVIAAKYRSTVINERVLTVLKTA